jgi:hypothetical protein
MLEQLKVLMIEQLKVLMLEKLKGAAEGPDVGAAVRTTEDVARWAFIVHSSSISITLVIIHVYHYIGPHMQSLSLYRTPYAKSDH